MKSHILTAVFLMIPLVLSGVMHMLVVSRNWLSASAIPISVAQFGKNKTWRGVLVMLVLTVPGVYLATALEPLLVPWISVTLSQYNGLLLGLSLGLGYVLAELPNSYLKRRLNIAPGERAENHAVFFSFVDQVDSALGCAIVYWLLLNPPGIVLVWAVLLGPVVHMFANVSLYSMGLRKHPL